MRFEPLKQLTSDLLGCQALLLNSQDSAAFQQTYKLDLKPSKNGPAIFTSAYLEQFFFFRLPDGDTFLAGPCLHEEMTDIRLSAWMNDVSARQEQRAGYYRRLPVISKKKWHAMAHFAFWSVYGKKGVLAEQGEAVQVEQSEPHLSRRKQTLSFHHDPSHEQKLMDAIQKGLIQDVIEIVQSGPADGGEFGVLSKRSFIRSQKNLAIASITLATRAAMKGGVHPETAYTISDVYIQRLEELQEVKQVEALLRDALCAFTERVQKARLQAYSPTILKCLRYIEQHVYEPIRLEEIAVHVDLSLSHVSARLKKETGMTVGEAIQKARVEEAKSLLKLSTHPIAAISAWLHFTDQSHFTKVFKKHAGLTPKKYRQSISS